MKNWEIENEQRADTEPSRLSPVRHVAVLVFALILVVTFGLTVSGTARAAWQEVAAFLSLLGDPEPASASVLSEHEIELLDQMSPQAQAELLLERSINHYRGANEQIAARVAGSRGA